MDVIYFAKPMSCTFCDLEGCSVAAAAAAAACNFRKRFLDVSREPAKCVCMDTRSVTHLVKTLLQRDSRGIYKNRRSG